MRTRNRTGFLENVFSSNKSGMEKSLLWSCVHAPVCWERTEHTDSALQKMWLLVVYLLANLSCGQDVDQTPEQGWRP
ncbi:hypothetical protein AV530_002615 [Patagioenas fasciata monilis]|uniref:Uncharacterized protein n=1 Tax=Patagioenas fasciata monilis TaxID=372326 RepID=A0A1V4K725_PATFA|nr:hypothetical protein AV530_002615 [Patagioenas fasciata monilis]